MTEPEAHPNTGTELMLTETLGDRLLSVAADLESLASTGNRALVHRFLDAVETGDLDAALECLRPEVRYTIPGRGSASGNHIGHEAVRAALRASVRPGAETLQFLTHEVMGSGSPIVSSHEVLAGIDGMTVRYRMLLLFSFTAGAISEIHEFTDDQYLADDLFGTAVVDRALAAPAVAPTTRRWRDRLPFRGASGTV
ncbi:MAG: nuclear transport factor 2 family protein [Actinomycetota bacterium]